MNAKIHEVSTLQHAASIIRNNADDLRTAFIQCDGSFDTCDADIQSEILDMENTASNLYLLSKSFSKYSGLVKMANNSKEE